MNKFLSKGKIVERGYYKGSHYIAKSNTGYWSKYGGGRLVETVNLPIWNCQACGKEQVDVLPYYLFEYPLGEYIKICGLCRHIVLRYDLTTIEQLIHVARDEGVGEIIANLMTLPLPSSNE